MKRSLVLLFLLFISLLSPAPAQAPAKGQKESGLAAVYTSRLNHHVTSSGQIYNPSKMTAAHKTLPYGSRIRVTNPKNHKSVELRVNDRGPKQAGRILDISPAAAAKLGIGRRTMRTVDLEVIEVGNGKTTSQHKH